MLRITVLLMVAAVFATAQIPMHRPIGQCATFDATEGSGDEQATDHQQREEFKIPGSIFFVPPSWCAAYAFFGWEKTMELYLGEGAEEYRELIERAVEVWNETVSLPSGDPLIKIVNGHPQNYLLPESFSSPDADTDALTLPNARDNESVIYFKPYGEGQSSWGFTWYRSSYSQMAEADVYINTYAEEEHSPNTLILAKRLADVDDSYGAYALYNKTYSVILHELGHAVGVKHIPVSGNIMNRNFGEGGSNQWTAAIALDLFSDFSPRRNKFVRRHDRTYPYMSVSNRSDELLEQVEFFTENAKLGEQEKMALTCIYEY